MTHYLWGFQRAPGEEMVVQIKITRAQAKALLGDRADKYDGLGDWPVEGLDFFVGEVRALTIPPED